MVSPLRYHSALLGCNTGWDRYLDHHLGVWCEEPAKLDKIAPKMCEAGVGFHAHSGTGNVGSIWSSGVGGLAIEFHGARSWSPQHRTRDAKYSRRRVL